MPISVSLWKLGPQPEKIEFSPIPLEDRLEEVLMQDMSILDPNLFLIGRQVITKHGKKIDLLAMDADGKLVVIELKRDKTPRDVVAQLLDYGSWIRTLEDEEIASIYSGFLAGYYPEQKDKSLDEMFCAHFGVKDMPETLNDGHELLLVASELDSSSERIVNYLSDEYGVSINVVFFRYFKNGASEYLSRVWLIDPGEAETKTTEKRGDEAWNGEYYVSFGEGRNRKWADAREHGYVSAGGGQWYSQTLEMFEPGARIWVNVPGQGYVGVGKVLEKVKSLKEFTLPDGNGKHKPVWEVVSDPPDMNRPEEKYEHFVKVEWIKTFPLEEAVKEKGFFGNQNSVARPKSRKWAHTVERLKQRWGVE